MVAGFVAFWARNAVAVAFWGLWVGSFAIPLALVSAIATNPVTFNVVAADAELAPARKKHGRTRLVTCAAAADWWGLRD